MIRDCKRQPQCGFFLGQNCPICNDEGKFIMSDRERDILGRRMAGILRHFPEKFDLDMDLNGWVDVREMVEAITKRDRRMHWLRPHHIRAVSETCTKGRYDVRGDMVRATYAHTVEIELDLPSDETPNLLISPAPQRNLHICLNTVSNLVTESMSTCQRPLHLLPMLVMFTTIAQS